MNNLTDKNLQDLRSSTITEETIARYGIASLSESEVRARLNRNDISGGGWFIQYPNSSFFRIKLDNPPVIKRQGKKDQVVKYLNPSGVNLDLFVTHLAQEKRNDIAVPFYFTEGEKKALALEQLGYAAIGLPGVNGYSKNKQVGNPLLNLVVKDRQSNIVYDSDKYNNSNVLKAEHDLVIILRQLGAKDGIISFSPSLGKGIDDVIKSCMSVGNLEDFKKRCLEAPESYEDYIKRIKNETTKVSQKLFPIEIAEKICKKYQLIYSAENFYAYKDGVYRYASEEIIRRWILIETGVNISFTKITEIFNFAKIYAYIEEEKLNQSPLLNLKEGLFNIDTYELLAHKETPPPGIYSTIQLPISYNPQAKCEKWIKTLYEILEGSEEKAQILQEFFGLCLTRETRYEKALLLIGEGANGKSVILNTIEQLIGNENCTSIPLEKFNDSHYMANLFGKLANISIETNAKSEVYDSTFKAVISGDPIQADIKFKNPIKFRPFCKLVFAMNNLPRVDDKTNAFFRRLLIVRFNREFTEEEQNKRLKEELLTELDGIFNFCIEGLKRLKARTYFNITEQIQVEINEYRKENNNVLIFVEEECLLDTELSIEKGELYSMYADFCKKNGYWALSKKKFGILILKLFEDKGVKDDRDYSGRIWRGIGKVSRVASCP